jgi:N-acetylmuramoyl-L-alanine amidase
LAAKRHAGVEAPGARRPRNSRRDASAMLLALIMLSSVLRSGAAVEKHLSVYSLAANYSVPIMQREGHEYVGLLEILEPLGRVSAKADGARWRLRYNNVEANFIANKNRAQILGRDADVGGKFVLENRRGLVPVSSLASLLPRILGGPVTLHEMSDRLFIGSVATHFTASLSSDNPPRLVFHFSGPVNPSIANEPGTLRMMFSREPLVGPASPTLTFGSRGIPSASYSETNGSALVTVNTTVPVMASFSNDGRTITVAAAAAQNPTSTATASPNPQTTTPAPPSAGPSPTPTVPAAAVPRYFAVLDASHGGDDHGETLSNTLLEKDVTLALARSLRQELQSRGITTLVLRDSDANLSLDQRAVYANADRAAIYIALHAASSGRGVRVYTALLPFGGDDHSPFRAWTTAQHDWLLASQSTANAIAGELQKRQVSVKAMAAPLRPLNNIIGPAIAVELAPQGSNPNQLTAPDYQQLVTSAVATAIASIRDQLAGAQPQQ